MDPGWPKQGKKVTGIRRSSNQLRINLCIISSFLLLSIVFQDPDVPTSRLTCEYPANRRNAFHLSGFEFAICFVLLCSCLHSACPVIFQFEGNLGSVLTTERTAIVHSGFSILCPKRIPYMSERTTPCGKPSPLRIIGLFSRAFMSFLVYLERVLFSSRWGIFWIKLYNDPWYWTLSLSTVDPGLLASHYLMLRDPLDFALSPTPDLPQMCHSSSLRNGLHSGLQLWITSVPNDGSALLSALII